jgi:hypothetical protein
LQAIILNREAEKKLSQKVIFEEVHKNGEENTCMDG